jgi:hypothetical protein
MGMTAVLHTWGQNLNQHVHLHCLIPGGALSKDQWHYAKSNYLFPVKALSKHVRGAMVRHLRSAYQNGELHRFNRDEVEQRLGMLMKKDWVVYSKAWLKHADTIVRYLGRYTHKIAISDARIKNISDSQVTFGYKDYRDGQNKRMQLKGAEFIRRFLLHVLPEGLMRIRHYGFLSNRSRKQKMELIKACLQTVKQPTLSEDEPVPKPSSTSTCPCPKCRTGHLRICFEIPAKPG